MSEIDQTLFYSKTHEWIRVEDDDQYRIGISDHAQHLLGDLVFVELPEVGAELMAGDECGVVESVKTASDVYSPVAGEVIAVNEALTEEPGLINKSPYDKGWLFKLKLTSKMDLDDLLNADAYKQLLENEEA